jgi:hypothetical protein
MGPVAYDVLLNCQECPLVDTFIALGSPLGIQKVRDELVESTFHAESCSAGLTCMTLLDPTAVADPALANDYRAVEGKSVEDIKESNWSSWRYTITHYVAGTRFRVRAA